MFYKLLFVGLETHVSALSQYFTVEGKYKHNVTSLLKLFINVSIDGLLQV